MIHGPELVQQSTGARVVDPHRATAATGHDVLTVRREGDAGGTVRVQGLGLGDAASRPQVPDTHPSIVTRRGGTRAGRVDVEAPDQRVVRRDPQQRRLGETHVVLPLPAAVRRRRLRQEATEPAELGRLVGRDRRGHARDVRLTPRDVTLADRLALGIATLPRLVLGPQTEDRARDDCRNERHGDDGRRRHGDAVASREETALIEQRRRTRLDRLVAEMSTQIGREAARGRVATFRIRRGRP